MAGLVAPPSQGRIVLFRDHRLTTWPALVVDLYNAEEPSTLDVDLSVFTSEGISFHRHVPYSENPERAFTWFWPPRVEAGKAVARG